MNIKTAFPSKWIRAADLQCRDITLTIARFSSEEEVANDGTTKPVIFFHGTEKGLVLNVVNADTIAAIAGEETDVWIGQQITLYPTKTDFGGKRVDCIRIRDLAPAQQACLAPPALNEQPVSVPPADSAIPF